MCVRGHSACRRHVDVSLVHRSVMHLVLMPVRRSGSRVVRSRLRSVHATPPRQLRRRQRESCEWLTPHRLASLILQRGGWMMGEASVSTPCVGSSASCARERSLWTHTLLNLCSTICFFKRQTFHNLQLKPNDANKTKKVCWFGGAVCVLCVWCCGVCVSSCVVLWRRACVCGCLVCVLCVSCMYCMYVMYVAAIWKKEKSKKKESQFSLRKPNLRFELKTSLGCMLCVSCLCVCCTSCTYIHLSLIHI